MTLLALLVACNPAPTDDTGPDMTDFERAGPWTPGRHTATVTDTERARLLTIETWYPTEAGQDEAPISALVVDADDRATYDTLLAAAPAGCPSLVTAATVDATPATGTWPVVAMSHCHSCTRFSTVTVAERLASHGFVVVAPDHAGNTLFDELDGSSLPLDTDTLAIREADLGFALDQALTGQLVSGLVVDGDQVGVYGHSFGAVTAAILLQDRLGQGSAPIAGMFVGAPPENPFLAGVSMENLDAPLMFQSLAEDHSVGEAGNLLIESNFNAAPNSAWWFELVDAGHWSPSDLVGLTAGFMPGCGEDTRESTGEAFIYMDPVEGRALSASLAAAFFTLSVKGDSAGVDWLEVEMNDTRVSAEAR